MVLLNHFLKELMKKLKEYIKHVFLIFILLISWFGATHASNINPNATQRFIFKPGSVAYGNVDPVVMRIRAVLSNRQINFNRDTNSRWVDFRLSADLDGIVAPGVMAVTQPHSKDSVDYFRKICPPGIRAKFKVTRVPDKHRVLGIMSCGEIENVNLHLVRQGMVWAHETAHLGELGQQMLAAQRQAKAERRGLWGLPNPVHPLQYQSPALF